MIYKRLKNIIEILTKPHSDKKGFQIEKIEEIWINEAINRYEKDKDNTSSFIDSALILKQAKSRYK